MNDTSLSWCVCLALVYVTSISSLFAYLPCSACTRARLRPFLRPHHRSASVMGPFINLLNLGKQTCQFNLAHRVVPAVRRDDPRPGDGASPVLC